jgi:hypothetical protein
MKKNYMYAFLVSLVLGLFLIGKAYAQSTYPTVAKIEPPTTKPVILDFSPEPTTYKKESTNIWKKR